jgi:hypothetical protein
LAVNLWQEGNICPPIKLAHLGPNLVACFRQTVKKIWAYKAANSLQNVGFWHFTAREIKYFLIKGRTFF